MLGHGALGQFALGQGSGTTTTSLVASVGTFALTGQASTFKIGITGVAGSFVLTGQAAPLQVGLVPANASFALTGQTAIPNVRLSADFASFALTGFASTEEIFDVLQPGVFALTGSNVFYSLDFNKGGTILQPAGSAFTRQRYRELLAAEEADREAKRKAVRLKKREQRKAALAAAEQARQAVLAARQAQHDDWAEQDQIRKLTAAISGFSATQNIQEAMRHSQAMAQSAQAHHAHMMAQDEDEAISLLMLHG